MSVRSRKRRALAWVARIGVPLLILVGGLEGGVRLLGLAPKVYRMRSGIEKTAYRVSENPMLGYVLKESYRDADAPDLHESFPSTNTDGQRDVERTHARHPGWHRILLLGDSVVAGHGIFRIDDTLSRQLERELAGRKVEVLNFGVGGYCTRSEVELLEEKGLKYQPDTVVLLFVMNDYYDLNSQVDHYSRRRPALDWLFLHSDLFRFCSLRFDLFHFREEVDPTQRARRNRDALGGDNVDHGLRRLAELSRSERFTTLIALWPDFLDGAINDPVNPQHENSIQMLAARYGFEPIPLAPHFQKDYAARCPTGATGCEGPKSLYTIGDGMHPSVLGAQVGAQALHEILAERGLDGAGHDGTVP